MKYSTTTPGSRAHHGTRLLISWVALALGGTLAAQETDESDTKKDANEVIKLSPFEITDDSYVGYGATQTSSGSRIVMKLSELPQVINVVTPELLADMEIDTPVEAMQRVASGTSGFSGTGGVNVTIRGFRAQNWAIDGATSRYRSVINNYLFDRIEVIKGPSTLLFGPFGSFGGYVNANAKYANKNMRNQVFAAVGTDSHYAGMLDVGGQIGATDKSLYRVVLAYHDEDKAGIDYDYTKYFVFGPSIYYEFSDKARLKVRLEYIDSEQKEGRSALDANGNLLTSFSSSGPLELTKHPSKSYGLQAIFEAQISDEWNLRINGAMQYLLDEPLVTGTLSGNRIAPQYNFSVVSILTTQLGTYADLSLAWSKDKLGKNGHISHDFVFGAEINYWNIENVIYDSVRIPGLNPKPLNPSNPDWTGLDFDLPFVTRRTPYSIEWLGGAFVQETLGFFDRKLLLTGGMKWNYDARTNQQQALDVNTPQGVMVTTNNPYAIESTPTFQYGIVYKPIPTLSAFIGHSESYMSRAGTQRKSDGSVLEPQEGVNDEIGFKLDFPDIWEGVLSGSVSYFQTEVTNIVRPDPNAVGFVVQDGVQENNGWEAQITYGGPKFSWLVGYYNSDGPVTTSDPRKPQAPFAPNEIINLWGKYRLSQKLEVGGGYRWQSETESNLQDGMQTDAYGTFDAFVTYTIPFSKGTIRYRAGVTNLADERASFRMDRPALVYLIEGRRVKVSATYTW
ncbi:MAG: TonB-dependent receptor [Opitutaceae bacterium]|nr:TonB-dependent receptor [Cephaloticoccus sp.]MCP5529421.1 TonB-dependent receptor [Opitutaceae bacterium]